MRFIERRVFGDKHAEEEEVVSKGCMRQWSA
jgi:hypothetical protein